MLNLLAQAEAVGGPIWDASRWMVAAPMYLCAAMFFVPLVLILSWLGVTVYKRIRDANNGGGKN